MFPLLLLDRQQLTLDIERRMAEVQGIINAQQAELARLTGLADALDLWNGPGLRSLSQWVAWRTGAGIGTARAMAKIVERAEELPVTGAAFAAGELSLDQVAAVATF